MFVSRLFIVVCVLMCLASCRHLPSVGPDYRESAFAGGGGIAAALNDSVSLYHKPDMFSIFDY